MSRRGSTRKTPTEQLVTSSVAAQEFFDEFTKTFEAELRSDRVRTEINGLRADINRIPDHDAGRRLQAILWGIICWLLRHGELASKFAGLESDVQDGLIVQIGDFAAGLTDPDIGLQPRPLTSCEYHGYTVALGRRLCSQCPCELPVRYDDRNLWTASEGARNIYPSFDRRQRDYCSRACRQRAYRRRLKERSDGHTST